MITETDGFPSDNLDLDHVIDLAERPQRNIITKGEKSNFRIVRKSSKPFL